MKFAILLALIGEVLSAAGPMHSLRFEAPQESAASVFIARPPGQAIFLTPCGVTTVTERSVSKIILEDANPLALAEGVEPSSTRTSYLAGDESQWRLNVRSYARVRFTDIYPGIDLTYSGEPGRVNYEFLVNAGADASQIRLRLEGPEVAAPASVAIQENHESRRLPIPAFFSRSGSNALSLSVPRHDRAEPMSLTFSTYLGGSGEDAATGIAVDSSGNAYISGWTESLDLPASAGTRLGNFSSVDAFVAKFSPTGEALYVTYLGGNGQNQGLAVGVDSTGAAVIVGSTSSSGFPVVNAAQPNCKGNRNAFVAKLNPAGTGLIFSTYWGGSGIDSANAVAVDSSGAIYVAGETTSGNFPVASPVQPRMGGSDDAFVTKFSGIGTPLYSTYLGGALNDRATAIAVDSLGSAYITGSTYSSDFPALNALQVKSGGGQDAFVAKISPSGSALVYSTYLGGTGGSAGAPETGSGIAVDASGCAYVAGATSSPNFPTSNAYQSSLNGGEDAFLIKLSATGGALAYGTYLGGSGVDYANAVAVDSSGNAYIAGYTASVDFPLANASQNTNAGDYDGFVAEIGPGGNTLLMGTYFGGMASDAVNAIALDKSDNIYLAGQSLSTNFPVTAALQANALSVESGWVALSPVPKTNPQLISPSPGTVLSSPTVTLVWTQMAGAQNYWVDVGTAPRSGNISGGYTGGSTTISVNVNGYLSGANLYVQIYAIYPGVAPVPGTGALFQFATAANSINPTLTSPASGTVIASSPVTFAWAAVSGAQDDWIDVGTSARSGNIWAGYTGGATSMSLDVSAYLSGGYIYVQLYSKFAGSSPTPGTGSLFQFATMSTRNPVLTSPAAGTVLSTPAVTFNWTAVGGAQNYWIDVGTSRGQGNIFGGYTGGATFETVNLGNYLGQTVYVQLYSIFPGISPAPGSGSFFQFVSSR